MWPFKKTAASAEIDKTRTRDQLLKDAQKAARDGDLQKIYMLFVRLQHEKQLADPVVADVASGIVDLVARRDKRDGLNLAIWLVNQNSADAKEMARAVTEKAFLLLDTLQKDDTPLTASAAMMCLVIASTAEAGSEAEKKALQLWDQSVDALSSTHTGMSFAFAAASNAILGFSGKDSPLRGRALDKWEHIVTKLADSDRPAALAETIRVANGYEAFGAEATAFRQKALQTMKKISR